MRIISISLFLSVFTNLRTSHSALTEKTTWIISNLIFKLHKFDDDFWDMLDEDEVLLDLKSYSIAKESVSLRDDILDSLGNIEKRKEFKFHLLNFINEMIDIENFYNKMVLYRWISKSSMLLNETIDECNNILMDAPERLLKSARAVVNLLYFERTSILENLNGTSSLFSRTCSPEDRLHSVQLMFYNYLKLIVAAEVKIFFLLNVSQDVLNFRKVHEFGNESSHNSSEVFFTLIHPPFYNFSEFSSTQTKYEHRLNFLNNKHRTMVDVIKTLMLSTSRNVWRCDPDKHEEGITHIRLNHVFQALLRAPNDIEQTGQNTYKDLCGDSTGARTRKILCPYRSCNGPLLNCEENYWISVLDTAAVCLSEKGSNRAYDFVEQSTSDGIRREYNYHGPKEYRNCNPRSLVQIKLEFELPFHLSYCTCDDNLNNVNPDVLSERTFYTGEVVADTSKNYVVTGARLRKQFGLIYVQIQHGKLLPGGNIDESTVVWKEISDDDLEFMRGDPFNHYTISWPDRYIELQDSEVPRGHVLVGFGFNHIFKSVNRLEVEAYSYPFDFNTGKLIPEYHRHVGDISNDHFWTSGSILPSYSLPNDIAVSDQYLSFGISDYDTDFGQTTIPFIDTQNITTKVPSPMSGVGLFYRKSRNDRYSGFLSLKLKTYDISKHLPIN